MSDSLTACLVDPSTVAPLRSWPQPARLEHIATHHAAFEAGVQAGRAAALAEEAEANAVARKALEQAASALRQAAAELRAARAVALKTDVHDAVALAVDVVEALVGSLPKGLNARRLEEALALAPEDELAVVRLHPDDVETAISLPVDAKVVADETVQRGGCIVEVGATRIDAQIGPALERLRSALGVVGGPGAGP